MDPTTWTDTTWIAISAVVTAVATFALAFFGGVAIWREKRREAERAKAADALVQRYAYPLRRQLLSWLQENDPWPKEDLGRQKVAHKLSQHFDAAEERVEGMLEAAAGASEDTARAAREASELFWQATGFLNEAAAAASRVTARDPDYREPTAIEFEEAHVARRFDEVQHVLRQAVRKLTTAMGETTDEAERLLRSAADS